MEHWPLYTRFGRTLRPTNFEKPPPAPKFPLCRRAARQDGLGEKFSLTRPTRSQEAPKSGGQVPAFLVPCLDGLGGIAKWRALPCLEPTYNGCKSPFNQGY